MRVLNSKPFFRGKKQSYYCWIDGHLKALGKTKRAAWDRYRDLVARRDELGGDKPWTVCQCFDHYLEHAATMKPNTYRNREQILGRFCLEAKVGKLVHHDLTADHLEAWVKSREWSPSMRRSAINYVMSAFNYCLKRKKIAENPIHGVTRPRWERRKAVISGGDEQKIFDASQGSFRDILTVLRSSGARPNELCTARIEHYNAGVITLNEHKEDESGDNRVIYLTTEARLVVERLIGSRTEGSIFRNSRGQPWTPDTLYCRFKRLRKKLGLGEGIFPYALRAKFTSDAINNGNANPALIAKSLGHADLNMLLKHYLREDPEAVRRALDEVAKR